jgi:NAD(P)-dependent dehydrogenase (short-subunit alcohol dehydrogenase family)
VRLKGKVAIVTGAAGGIGAAYAKGLAREGAAVGICDVQDPQKTVGEITASGGRAIGGVVDITNQGAISKFAEQLISEFGSIDILVNNAAFFSSLTLKPFAEISDDEWDRVMTVNVRGSLQCVKAVAPQMKKQKYGKIINVSSATIYKGMPFLMHYVTSKAAVVGMSRCLARELGDDGIRVNCITPGFTLSEAVAGSGTYSKDFAAGLVNARAIKREEVPEDLVGTVVYLSSPDSDFVTGQTIVVDGGAVML